MADQVYSEDDVRKVCENAGARDWDQLLSFLGDNPAAGLRDLTEDDVRAMRGDVQQLKDDDEPFTDDPMRLWQMLAEKQEASSSRTD